MSISLDKFINEYIHDDNQKDMLTKLLKQHMADLVKTANSDVTGNGITQTVLSLQKRSAYFEHKYIELLVRFLIMMKKIQEYLVYTSKEKNELIKYIENFEKVSEPYQKTINTLEKDVQMEEKNIEENYRSLNGGDSAADIKKMMIQEMTDILEGGFIRGSSTLPISKGGFVRGSSTFPASEY